MAQVFTQVEGIVFRAANADHNQHELAVFLGTGAQSLAFKAGAQLVRVFVRFECSYLIYIINCGPVLAGAGFAACAPFGALACPLA